MKDNLPMISEKKFIKKIKSFFAKLFCKAKNEEVIVEDENINNENIAQKDFLDSVKTEVDKEVQKERERKELFKKIRENPEVLKTMSNEQLQKLSDYYEQVIKENEKIIEKKELEIKKLKKVV